MKLCFLSKMTSRMYGNFPVKYYDVDAELHHYRSMDDWIDGHALAYQAVGLSRFVGLLQIKKIRIKSEFTIF